MNDVYSPYKVVHHINHLQDLKAGIQTVPIQVQMVPSNVCNQRCSFCAYRMKGSLSSEDFINTQTMDTEKVIECLDCFKSMGVRAVHYTGGGEPLVHGQITKIFKHTMDLGLDLALVTNGMAFSQEQIEMLSDVAWVRISVDAADSATYSKLRNTPERTMFQVNTNITELARVKKNMVLGVGFVVCKDNFQEIYEAARIYKEFGVDNFRISAAFHPDGYAHFDSFKDEAAHLAKAAESLSDDKFKVFNLFDERVKDVFMGTQDYDYCPIKDLLTYVGADYNVYTCCTLAYNKRGLIGSIKNQSFKTLWESHDKWEKFLTHNPRVHCKFPCMYAGKNKFINYCINNDAKHTSFI